MNEMPRISFEDIRERAYELWERHRELDAGLLQHELR